MSQASAVQPVLQAAFSMFFFFSSRLCLWSSEKAHNHIFIRTSLCVVQVLFTLRCPWACQPNNNNGEYCSWQRSRLVGFSSVSTESNYSWIVSQYSRQCCMTTTRVMWLREENSRKLIFNCSARSLVRRGGINRIDSRSQTVEISSWGHRSDQMFDLLLARTSLARRCQLIRSFPSELPSRQNNNY